MSSHSHAGHSLCAIKLLMLMIFDSGVESFQQSSHDGPWDLLVLVYQRLDCLLHLRNDILIIIRIQLSHITVCQQEQL